jgi:hypothetical protein
LAGIKLVLVFGRDHRTGGWLSEEIGKRAKAFEKIGFIFAPGLLEAAVIISSLDISLAVFFARLGKDEENRELMRRLRPRNGKLVGAALNEADLLVLGTGCDIICRPADVPGKILDALESVR